MMIKNGLIRLIKTLKIPKHYKIRSLSCPNSILVSFIRGHIHMKEEHLRMPKTMVLKELNTLKGYSTKVLG